MKLAAPADCEAMLNELHQSIALVAHYQIKSEATLSCRDRWQASYFSPACQTLYGYRADELIADPQLWRSRLHPTDWQARQTAIDRSLQAHSPAVTQDYRVHHADGSWRWLRESLTFRRDAQGWMATGIAFDISDRQQIEQRQAKAIAQLEAQLVAERERYQLATSTLR